MQSSFPFDVPSQPSVGGPWRNRVFIYVDEQKLYWTRQGFTCFEADAHHYKTLGAARKAAHELSRQQCACRYPELQKGRVKPQAEAF
jgi:hypothetical protein